MSKILGLDYGKKRCGISISDELQIIASPLTTIDTKKLMFTIRFRYQVDKAICEIIIFLKIPRKLARNNSLTLS